MEKIIIERLKAEIEKKCECEVVSISLCSIMGTPNVQCKIKYNDDFVYKPCDHFTPDTICFSERSVTFFRRIDYFDCMKDISDLSNRN